MGIISHFSSFVNSFFEKSQKKLFSDRCKTVKKAQIHVCPEPKIHFFRESLIFFEKRLDKRLNLWYNITVPKRRFLCKGRRWCGSMAEQLICNQQVVGSTPITSSNEFTQRELLYGRFPEWPKGADCKSVVADFGGPNPPSPTKIPAQMCGYFFFLKKSARHNYSQNRNQKAPSGRKAPFFFHFALPYPYLKYWYRLHGIIPLYSFRTLSAR